MTSLCILCIAVQSSRWQSVTYRIQKKSSDKDNDKQIVSSVPPALTFRSPAVTLCTARFNPLTHNDHYRRRTAPLTSKRCILYIYSTNIGTEYFKHGIYSPFFPLQNAVCFTILTYLVLVLFTFHIQNVLKFKKIIPTPKG